MLHPRTLLPKGVSDYRGRMTQHIEGSHTSAVMVQSLAAYIVSPIQLV
jgi:hypothetical protein